MNENSLAVEIIAASKRFYRSTGRQLLRGHFERLFRRASENNSFYVLKNVSLQLQRGEGLAIVGANGAGKSTLLALIVGLMRPDEGIVRVNGRVAALLELGSGFHPDLSGRENLFLNAALLGLKRKEIQELYEPVVEFAGIREFMDQPLRTYSTGMAMRLAFSVAIHTNPDILVIDEALAVGDENFQQKCLAKIREFRQAGKTMISVSHSPVLVTSFCDKAIWLDAGEIVTQGDIGAVLDAYQGRVPSAV